MERSRFTAAAADTTLWEKVRSPLDKQIKIPYNGFNFMKKAMIRTSNMPHKHTESSRMMRGAWKAVCEYIFELHTQRQCLVGCDGSRTRYSARVYDKAGRNVGLHSKRQEGVSLFVNIRWYSEMNASSF
jgi:hypothetical protein